MTTVIPCLDKYIYISLDEFYMHVFFKLQVSHDEHLISGSVEELWVVSEGKVTPFHGTFNDYKKILQSS